MVETYLHRHPDMSRILSSDTSALATFMREAEARRTARLVKFPSIKGPDGNYDVPSFQTRHKDSPSFIKWNLHSQPPHHGCPLAPHRDNYPIIDASSGMIGAAADVDLCSNTKNIPSLARDSDKVNLSTPATKVRNKTDPKSAHPWDDLVDEDDLEEKWNSRKIPDAAIRASLGGCTSDEKVVPKKGADDRENLVVGSFAFEADNWRDQLAKKFMYTSSNQKNYLAVDWDKKLERRVKASPDTLEGRPDLISQRLVVWPMTYQKSAEFYQRLGPSWDRFQMRDKSHGKRPYNFKSEYSKLKYVIPGYGGHIGRINNEDRDHPDEKMQLLTQGSLENSRRSVSTCRGPNIPGYTGRVHWTTSLRPANSSNPINCRSISASVFRDQSVAMETAPRSSRTAPFSRMVTTVEPKNPFNKIETENIDNL